MKYEDLERVNQTLKTTDIKGKEYAEVNQRIKAFRMLYPEGTIQTEILQNIDGVIVMKAIVGYYNEDNTFKILGTGTAYEKENSTFINKTSYVENCETSAVGRALGMCGIGIDTSVASADEVINAINNQTITKEDAENYVLNFGKHSGKKLTELDSSYLHWLYENNEQVKPIIDVLGILPSEEQIIDMIPKTQHIIELIDETGIDFEKIKGKYDINSLNEATPEQLNEIETTLEKHKSIQDKAK